METPIPELPDYSESEDFDQESTDAPSFFVDSVVIFALLFLGNMKSVDTLVASIPYVGRYNVLVKSVLLLLVYFIFRYIY